MAGCGDLPFSRMANICSVIGISTFFLRARPTAALVVKTPSATAPCMSGDDVGQFAAFAQFNADAAVAREISGAGQNQIAQSGESGHGVEASAAGHDQARHFGETARDQRRHRIVAEAEAIANAGSDGDDVLQRAAQLHADHVVVGIDAKAGIVERLLHGARHFAIDGRHGHGRRIAPRYFLGKRRAAQRRHARRELAAAQNVAQSLPSCAAESRLPVPWCS